MIKLSNFIAFLFITIFSQHALAYYGIKKVSVCNEHPLIRLEKKPFKMLVIQYTDRVSTCNYPKEIESSSILIFRGIAGKEVFFKVNTEVPVEIFASESIVYEDLHIGDFKQLNKISSSSFPHTLTVAGDKILVPECLQVTLRYLHKLWEGYMLRLHVVEVEGEPTLAAYEIL